VVIRTELLAVKFAQTVARIVVVLDIFELGPVIIVLTVHFHLAVHQIIALQCRKPTTGGCLDTTDLMTDLGPT